MSILLEKLVRAIELGASAFLAAVTGVMFVSVFLRYLFSWSIPDSYDFVRLVLGILILWGLAGTSYRGEHITVDLLWGALPRGGRIALDIFATVVTLAGLGVFAWMMGTKVLSTFVSPKNSSERLGWPLSTLWKLSRGPVEPISEWSVE